MALTESNMLPLGTIAPAFQLIDTVDDQLKTLDQLKGEKRNISGIHVQPLPLCCSPFG